MTAISVVVPTYNRGHMISATLDSILAQTLPPDEIIAVDDGSSDNTQCVIDGYGDRVRSIVIENSGDLVARNTGLRAARNALVAFCDSDDIWMPDFLADMSAQWQVEPTLLACYSDFRILYEGGIVAENSKFLDAPAGYWNGFRSTGAFMGVFEGSVVERLLTFQPFFPSCMMVLRSAFIDIGGWDEQVSRIVGCDFATALRVAAKPPLGVVRYPLVQIRKHKGNISGDIEKMNLGDAQVLEHVLATHPEFAPLEMTFRTSITARRRAALDNAFSRRDFAATRAIHALLPRPALSAKQRIKAAIAALPSPLNAFMAGMLERKPTLD